MQLESVIINALKDRQIIVHQVNIEQGFIDAQSAEPISSNALNGLDAAINDALNNQCIKFHTISGLHDDKIANLQRITFFIGNSVQEVQDKIDEFTKLNQYDHRVINRDMHLFHIDPNISQGSIMWLPNGATVVNALKNYVRDTMLRHGYNEIMTPAFANANLWKKSGHWDMFQENMFECKSLKNHDQNDNDTQYCLKPMSCPFHCEIYKNMNPTYKQLPMKLFEFGLVHRNESSGSLHGLTRTKSFTQDDSHVFCAKEHIKQSVEEFCSMLRAIYNRCGFSNNNISVKLSTRPEKYAGSLETWMIAETMLKSAAVDSGLQFDILDGEGAFYGPKLEFHLLDRHNRSWQCGTLQLDLVMAQRLDVTYIDAHNNHQHPVIIHHAILGSIERFISVLIEHHNGRLPTWLSPIQIKLVTINENVIQYSYDMLRMLKNNGIRAVIDDTNNTLNYKIRKAQGERASFIGIIGDNEMKNMELSIRAASGSNQKISYDDVVEYMTKENSIE